MPALIWQFRVPSEMPLSAESVLHSRQKAHSEIVSSNVSTIWQKSADYQTNVSIIWQKSADCQTNVSTIWQTSDDFQQM